MPLREKPWYGSPNVFYPKGKPLPGSFLTELWTSDKKGLTQALFQSRTVQLRAQHEIESAYEKCALCFSQEGFEVLDEIVGRCRSGLTENLKFAHKDDIF